MTSDSIVIVGIGMVTPVGLTASETAAAVRAGTMRFTESSFRDKRFRPITVGEIPEDGLPPLADSAVQTTGLTAREIRLLRLASVALKECLTPLAGHQLRAGLCLALPEAETTRPLNRRALLRLVCERSDGLLEQRLSDASLTGRAGGLSAIEQASGAIRLSAAEFMVAGAIDTYRDPFILATLDERQRLKSASNLDGFIPGEGAAFLLLTRAITAATRGLPVLASLSQVCVGIENGHLGSSEAYRGDGLADVFRQLVVAGAVQAPVREVYSSMNGENHWAKEWGVAYLRNKSIFHDQHRIHHPADCFGDTGAACGPVLVGLAALGISRGYRAGPALVYGSSDGGPRSAVVVDRIA